MAGGGVGVGLEACLQGGILKGSERPEAGCLGEFLSNIKKSCAILFAEAH